MMDSGSWVLGKTNPEEILRNSGLGKPENNSKKLMMFFFKFLDEKKQYDPTGFRDAILEGLEASGDDLEAVIKFLVSDWPRTVEIRKSTIIAEVKPFAAKTEINVVFFFKL